MNSYRPQKRKRPRMGVRDTDSSDVPQYRAFVRRHACIVPQCQAGPIEAAHRRMGVPECDRGGVGMKPHDKWCFPACHDHHDEQHRIGEITFAKQYAVDPLKAVSTLWDAWLKTTDSGKRYRLQQAHEGERV